MTSRDFCYWLRGYMDALPDERLGDIQVQRINAKLLQIDKYEPQHPYPFYVNTNTTNPIELQTVGGA